MPIVLFGIFALLPIWLIETDINKEEKVNTICSEKFNTVDEIKQCKTILMNMREY